MKGKKLFFSVLISLLVCFSVFAESITVAVDSSSTYKPTSLTNGGFDTEPWMDYWIGSTQYTTTKRFTSYNCSITSSKYNATGWNTTENKTQGGSLFEYSSSQNSAYGYSMSGSTTGWVEMNSVNSAAFYQDLTTQGGDVIKWTLKHAARLGYGDATQKMLVKIGKPQMNGSTPVQATGVNNNIDNKIESGLGIYSATGITTGKGTVAFANDSELVNLDVVRKDSVGKVYWKSVVGIYVIPDGQTTTRFSFEVAPGSSYPGGGNLLDDITFATLIGNLHGQLNDDGSVTVYGYWGESDANKKLIIKSGDIVTEVDMTSVLNKNFIITIPESLRGAMTIELYHQDYEVAKRYIHIHNWKYKHEGVGISAYCDCVGSGSECEYAGEDNSVSVILATNRIDLTANFNPSIANSDSAVWTSSNTSVAKIESDSGIIRPVGVGSTTITATTKNGSAKSKSLYVKVLPEDLDSSVKVTSLTLNKTSLTLNGGQTETLTATIAPTNAAVKTVTFMSSDSTIAKVDSSTGLVTGVSSGSCYITAIANDGSGKMASCLVTVVVPVTGVSINRSSATVELGNKLSLVTYIQPSGATNGSVTWTSDNEDVATVSNGVVNALSLGSANITVKTEDGNYTSTCSVTVVSKTVAVTNIKLDKTSLTLTEGNTEKLTATVLPSNATDKVVTWSSSDTNVATVDENGNVKAVNAGTALIKATSSDGKRWAGCNVVTEADSTRGTASANGRSDVEWVQLWADGPKFATMNVGSTASTYSGSGVDATNEYTGGHYQWGGTVDCDTNVALGSTCMLPTSDIRGTGTIGTDTLGDTARLVWGSNWQMMSEKDAEMLTKGLSEGSVSIGDNTKWEYISGSEFSNDQYETGCSLEGWKVSGLGEYADNSIFLPNLTGTCLAGNVSAGEGLYWLSTPHDSSISVALCSSSIYKKFMAYGYSVRAVYVEPGTITAIKLSESSKELVIGNSLQLSATVYSNNATDETVIWTSDDTDVAIVDSTGKVTAKKIGTATITATANADDSKTTSCVVTVS